MRHLNQVGDTIVEVLLALAVLGSVLVGGYAISTRSLSGVRASQERSEALRVAESQIEILRSSINAANGEFTALESQGFVANPAAPSQQPRFCLTSSGSVEADLSNCSLGPENRYRTEVTVSSIDNVSNGPDLVAYSVLYSVEVNWDRVGGGQTEVLNLRYKTTLNP